LVSFYGAVGFIAGAPFGLVLGNIWEMFFWGALFGAFYGPIQSYLRAYFTVMIPKGHEAEFFSFFAISDKGSSWIGPLVVAAIRQGAGSMRYSLVYTGFMCIVPIPLFLIINQKKAIKQAHALGKVSSGHLDPPTPLDKKKEEKAKEVEVSVESVEKESKDDAIAKSSSASSSSSTNALQRTTSVYKPKEVSKLDSSSSPSSSSKQSAQSSSSSGVVDSSTNSSSNEEEGSSGSSGSGSPSGSSSSRSSRSGSRASASDPSD
jgi:hypothetical protein